LGEGIQVSSNAGEYLSPRGDNSKKVKIHRIFFKNLLQNKPAKIS
jgi:hypothetical protein